MLLVGLALGLSSFANAGLITINSTDTGWYASNGSHSPGNNNYYVHGSVNDFFIFDLASISENIVSATLRIWNPNNGFTSDDISEIFQIWDVDTNIASIVAGTGGVAAYNDFMSGVKYSETTVNLASNGSYVELNLNSSALAAMNSASGLFAFGGTLSTSRDGGYDRLFGYTGFGAGGVNAVHLELNTTVDVPEPSTLAIFALGMIGLASRRFKKQS